MVAIRQAGTYHLALVAVSLIGRKHADKRGGVNVAGVENTTQKVCANEMAVEGFAKPIAKFGLKHPVLPLLVVGKGKGIVIAREIGRPLRGKLHLYPEVQGGGEIVQKVAFYSYILCQKWHTKRK
jgi:hypothetical protein